MRIDVNPPVFSSPNGPDGYSDGCFAVFSWPACMQNMQSVDGVLRIHRRIRCLRANCPHVAATSLRASLEDL